MGNFAIAEVADNPAQLIFIRVTKSVCFQEGGSSEQGLLKLLGRGSMLQGWYQEGLSDLQAVREQMPGVCLEHLALEPPAEV